MKIFAIILVMILGTGIFLLASKPFFPEPKVIEIEKIVNVKVPEYIQEPCENFMSGNKFEQDGLIIQKIDGSKYILTTKNYTTWRLTVNQKNDGSINEIVLDRVK